MPSFFFRELQLITVLVLICNFYMSWRTRFVSLKLCAGFSIFDSVSFWLKFIFFCSTKCMDRLTLKRHNSFQNQNNKKAIHSFDPRSLVFKLRQEVLKFSNISVNWTSLKTDLEPNFLNFQNRSFEYATFSQ